MPSKSDSGEKGAQIDLVIDRADQVINICEMKFSKGRYSISKDYEESLRERIELFRQKTKTLKATVCTFVTTFGVLDDLHKAVVDSEVISEQLFE